MAELTEMPFGLWSRNGPRMHYRIILGAHWRHLANTTEPLIYGTDAAFLSNYFVHLLLLLQSLMRRLHSRQGIKRACHRLRAVQK